MNGLFDPIINGLACGVAGSAGAMICGYLKENFSASEHNYFLAPDNLALLEDEINKRLYGIDNETFTKKTPLYVIQPALQAWCYSLKVSEINNLFANLLCSAFLQRNQMLVHPAFVEIIKQLHPSEITFLKDFHTVKKMPLIFIKYGEFVQSSVYIGGASTDNSLNRVATSVLLDTFVSNLLNIEEIDIHLDNLARLRLITNENAYSDLKLEETEYSNLMHQNQDKYKELKSLYEKDNLKVFPVKGFIKLSNFGKRFYDICIKPQYVQPSDGSVVLGNL